MACFFILLLPCIFTHTVTAQSTLNPSTWYNNNSLSTTSFPNSGSRLRSVLSTRNRLGFACGFYCTGPCTSYAFSVVVVGGGDPGVVWSANRDHLVRENAKLELTQDGDLVLTDSDGTNVWSTNTSGNSITGMNITELGNLVLFNNNSRGSVIWQSFDHPTDALLVGQRLYEGQKLVSGSSMTNWSSGIYYATFNQTSGFAVYTQVGNGQSQMYYQLAPEQTSADRVLSTGKCRILIRSEDSNSSSVNPSAYAEILEGGFFVNWGVVQGTFGSTPPALPFDSYIEYTKLESDGRLKIYRHNNETGMSVTVDMVAQDLGECQYPRRCGEYGLCRDGQCTCPRSSNGVPYFRQAQVRSSSGGCSRVTPLTCQSSLNQRELIEVSNSSYFEVIDSDSALPGIRDVERCKQACMRNCSCAAAFFRYQNNASDGYCYTHSEVLTIREGQIPNHSFTAASYIKVQLPLNSSNPDPNSKQKTRNVAIIVVASVVGALIVSLLVVMLVRKFRKAETEDDGGDLSQVPGMPVRFSYEYLRLATEGFKERLGGGGFGSVFKGKLQDGTEIAVKRLDKLGQGVREFLAEVETMGSLHHFNLVRLIGFCAEKSSRLLVYEYLSNGSLDKWIFYRIEEPTLDWETRKKIILDVAKGLAYLHEECRQRIIHLDIKPQNILLDEKFNAKISDFGLSKLIDREESQVLTTLRGTPGYIAPECGKSKITVKVDIYSFGIVLLELVSGRKNLDRYRSESSKHLLAMLQKKAEEDRLIDLVEELDEDVLGLREEALRLIKIGAWCLQDDPTKRPLMSTVVKVLEGVMEVDPDINYIFAHAFATPTAVNDRFSAAPQASVLSNPR